MNTAVSPFICVWCSRRKRWQSVISSELFAVQCNAMQSPQPSQQTHLLHLVLSFSLFRFLDSIDSGFDVAVLVRQVIMSSKTIIWNGPMGVFEMGKFESGTKSMMDTMVRKPCSFDVMPPNDDARTDAGASLAAVITTTI
eukprot:1714512-Rhodomonas_salina.1